MSTKDLSESVEAASNVQELVEVFGGEDNLVLFVKKAFAFKEQQRLSHKKNYLKNQLILQEAKRRGITAD